MEYQDFDEKKLNTFYEKIGKNVQRIRSEKNITQLELAFLLGHNSAGHVAKAELNKYNKHFNLEHLLRISEALDVDINEFFVD